MLGPVIALRQILNLLVFGRSRSAAFYACYVSLPLLPVRWATRRLNLPGIRNTARLCTEYSLCLSSCTIAYCDGAYLPGHAVMEAYCPSIRRTDL